MLGVCVGAVAAGRIRVAGGRVVSGFVGSWLGLFPLAVGLLTLSLFAFLAAVYLTREAGDEALRDDFRARALAAGFVTGALAFAALAVARTEAAPMWLGLVQRRWSLVFHAVTGAAAVGALAALALRRYALAQAAAIAQVTLVLWGWGAAQLPYVVPPDLTFAATAAPPAVLRAVLGTLAVGAVVLIPSLAYLYRVFKGART